jgi:hypothetical protein
MRISAHYATGFDELAGFFRGLAASWRGWQGERVYEPLERDLRLTATHDGHVRLALQLRQSTVPDGWSVAAVMRLDPGEEMTGIARGSGGLAVAAGVIAAWPRPARLPGRAPGHGPATATGSAG